ncbi:MAG: hypothetical protein Q4D55_11110, partial [Eubacteriales bacterium]|nr:hypothetical protein [Eubacteriales bacterium]
FPVEIVKKIIKRLLFLVLRCKISMDDSLLLWKTRTSKEKKELKRGMGLEENRKKSREKENRV